MIKKKFLTRRVVTMLRAIMALLFAFLFLVVGIPVLGIEWLYGKINKKGAELSSLRIVQWAFSTIIGICDTDVIVKGAENIPAEEAVVYVGNHRSIFDVVIGYTHCPGLTGFIAKDNLEKIPLLRVWMRRLHCLFLDRTNPRDGLRVILAAIDDIKRGISIFVFPEGTRTKTGQMAPFKEGTFKISTKTGCAIIPVAITGTDEILRNHMPFVKKTTVVFHYGKPIYPDQLEADQKKHIGAYTQSVIADMLSEEKDLIL